MIAFYFSFDFDDYMDIKFEAMFASSNTIEDIVNFFINYTKYDKNTPVSIFKCNETWIKELEYKIQDKGDKNDTPPTLAKLINNPHQKFYLEYYFQKTVYVKVTLVKMEKIVDKIEIPKLTLAAKRIPKLYNNKVLKKDTDCQTEDKLIGIENILKTPTDDNIEPNLEDIEEIEDLIEDSEDDTPKEEYSIDETDLDDNEWLNNDEINTNENKE